MQIKAWTERFFSCPLSSNSFLCSRHEQSGSLTSVSLHMCLATSRVSITIMMPAQPRNSPTLLYPSCVSMLLMTLSLHRVVSRWQEGQILTDLLTLQLVSDLFECLCGFCSIPGLHSPDAAKRCPATDGSRRTHCLLGGSVSSRGELHGAPVRSVCPGSLWTPEGHQESLRHGKRWVESTT